LLWIDLPARLSRALGFASGDVIWRRRSAARVRLEAPSRKREAEFLERVRASQKLHRPWLQAPSTAAQFREFVTRSQGERFESFFVCRADTSELAGVINLNEIVRGLFHSAYLGYYAFEPFAGFGYMSDGLGLVLNEAFGALDLHRLEANVQPGNLPSIRLVSGLGFRLEGFSPRYLKIAGRWRDHERWAILRDEWPKSRVRR
jgi:ribosomal-protein-alanine N-acetyltransferase